MTQVPDPGRIADLLALMARLRAPDGCPWDREQSFETIAPYTVEEAYEVADAIERGDMGALKDELGDLLFQVVFHAQMAEEAGYFRFSDVVEAIQQKMLRRHPHVFGGVGPRSASDQVEDWEQIKASERAAQKKPAAGLLDDIPRALPALTRAAKLTKRAATVGFDWPNLEHVFEKLDEEVSELQQAIGKNDEIEIAAEVGDVMFVVANLARKLGLDPEASLNLTNLKFVDRFRKIEQALSKAGKTVEQSNLEEMDALWTAAKNSESSSG